MTRITKITVHTDNKLSPNEMLDLFNAVQGCLSMGHDDGLFQLVPEFNIELYTHEEAPNEREM